MNELQEKDLQYIWHPCSQMKDYEKFPAIIIEKGEGAYLYDIEGKSYLDGVSSWWVNLFGHSNKRINKAIETQMNSLEHVIFANFSHKVGIEFSERLIKIAPKSLEKVFYSDNGSSAVEIALKMSFHYHKQTGNPNKTKFVALSDAYHGETLGALSVGDLDLFSEIYKPLLINTFKVQGPDCYRCKYEKCRESCTAECFENMEALFKEHHEEISCVIIEPLVQGAAGMKIYSPVYLQKLRNLCTKYNVHLIADEIAVGFGRTGKMFACEHANITPDFMCLSKGISAGYLPMSVVLTTNEVYNAFYADYTELKTFMHSHTYAGNALACAAAQECLNIFEEENILEKNQEKAELIRKLIIKRADSHPYVGEFRQLGMIAALELVKDKKTKEGFPWQERVGYEIYKIALSKGVILRPIGNVIYFMPPYIVDEKDIELMIDVAFEAIDEHFKI